MSDIKFDSSKNESPHKFVPLIAGIGMGASLLAGGLGAMSAGRAKREAERKEEDARNEMNRQRRLYQEMDLSNPFANMKNRYAGLQNQFTGLENTMEDLTVNKQQAEFERDMFQQSQANIMQGMRGAAGGSGIAALAQTLAQQGQLQSQRASASIGQQEAQNQRAAAATAGRLQEMEARGQESVDLRRTQGAAQVDQLKAQGEQVSQQRELDRQGTLLGMSQQETAAYMQQAQDANQAKWDSISSGIGNAFNFASLL
jgi:hypothetical protein